MPADYRAVHELFREFGLGPYAALPEATLETLVRRWWWVLALAALALAGGAAHIARAEWLVRARTQALREAMQERERLAREDKKLKLVDEVLHLYASYFKGMPMQKHANAIRASL